MRFEFQVMTCLFIPFLLVIAMSFLPFMAFDEPLGIFKLLLKKGMVQLRKYYSYNINKKHIL